MALRVRGEPLDEIAGAVTAMRGRMLKVDAPPGAIDIVGTGGDHSGSYNISTLAAIIVAAAACRSPSTATAPPPRAPAPPTCSPPSASRSASTRPGSSAASRRPGLCFMFAQTHHASMRHVAPVRVELGTRTLFNLLGPLSNPAGVKRQLLGVFSEIWLEPLTQVLKELGSERVWTVHGSDGLDEITTTGPTHVVALENGSDPPLHRSTPDDVGLPLAKPEDLKGGDPEHNAAQLRAVLDGEQHRLSRRRACSTPRPPSSSPAQAADLGEGARRAPQALDSGAAKATLDTLIRASNAT